MRGDLSNDIQVEASRGSAPATHGLCFVAQHLQGVDERGQTRRPHVGLEALAAEHDREEETREVRLRHPALRPARLHSVPLCERENKHNISCIVKKRKKIEMKKKK